MGSFATYLFAILVGNYVAFSRTGISTQDDAVLEETADDRCPGAGGLGKRDPAICQEVVPVESWRDGSLKYSGWRLT